MAKEKDKKTNVMRVLDQHGIDYKTYCYVGTDAVGGVDVAKVLGQDPEQVFKTLVTVGKSGEHYVFVIPVGSSLDLKKAAKASGEKNIEMIAQKELLPLTGYIHGGCSPIGMKKLFPTFVDETAELFDAIIFSAGAIGYQVELPVGELGNVVPLKLADLTE